MCSIRDEIGEHLPQLEKYALSLVGGGRIADAEDLVQDCMERALIKADQFQSGTNLKAWLFTMMRNIFLSKKRHDQVCKRHVDHVINQGPRVQLANQNVSILLKQTSDFIDGMSAKDRDVINDIAVHDKSFQAIADSIEEPVGTLKSRLCRARTKIRNHLGEASSDNDIAWAA